MKHRKLILTQSCENCGHSMWKYGDGYACSHCGATKPERKPKPAPKPKPIIYCPPPTPAA